MREHDHEGGRVKVRAQVADAQDQNPIPNSEVSERASSLSLEDLKPLQPSSPWSGLPNPLRYRAVNLFLTTISLCIILWIMAQVVSVVQATQAWPVFFQYFFLGLVCILVGLIVLQSAYLWRSYNKLREPKTWLMRDLQAFDNKTMECESAKVYLLSHLKAFPLEDVEHQRFLLRIGAQNHQIQELIEQRRDLIEKEFGSSREWLSTYRKRFAEPCEAIAKNRIKTMARRVAFSTMSCPIKSIDGIVILWTSFEICNEMNRLYQFRLSKMSMIILLLRAFRNSFIATQLEDLSDHATEALRNEIQNSAHTLLGDIATKLSARFAEGVANGLLINRLAKGLMKEMTVLRD